MRATPELSSVHCLSSNWVTSPPETTLHSQHSIAWHSMAWCSMRNVRSRHSALAYRRLGACCARLLGCCHALMPACLSSANAG